jgi:hypothetical protein
LSNKFQIPIEVEQRIRERDKNCVYCNKKMIKPEIGYRRCDWATFEHFREQGPFYWSEGLKEEDISICCSQCNSSRGKKSLLDWFESPYCKKRNINIKSVADPVKYFLKTNKYVEGDR